MDTGVNAVTRLYAILTEMSKHHGSTIIAALNKVMGDLSENKMDDPNSLFGLFTVFDLFDKAETLLIEDGVSPEDLSVIGKIRNYLLQTHFNTAVTAFVQNINAGDFALLGMLSRLTKNLGDGVVFADAYEAIKSAVEAGAAELEKLDLAPEDKAHLLDILFGFLKAVNRYKWDGRDGLIEEIDQFFGKAFRAANRAGTNKVEVLDILATVFKVALTTVDHMNNLAQLPETAQKISKVLGF